MRIFMITDNGTSSFYQSAESAFKAAEILALKWGKEVKVFEQVGIIKIKNIEIERVNTWEQEGQKRT